jgi:hypothetical protein
MGRIASVLQGVAGEVVTIATNANQKGADAADWVQAGGTREGLQGLILEARKVEVTKVVTPAPPPGAGQADYLTDSGNAERWSGCMGPTFVGSLTTVVGCTGQGRTGSAGTTPRR